VTQLEQYARARQPAPRLQRTGALPTSALGRSGSATETVSPLAVGVVDCLWNAAVGNAQSSARLLAVGGLDALLNLLEVAEPSKPGHSQGRPHVCGRWDVPPPLLPVSSFSLVSASRWLLAPLQSFLLDSP
jgi:hypothetical protein